MRGAYNMFRCEFSYVVVVIGDNVNSLVGGWSVSVRREGGLVERPCLVCTSETKTTPGLGTTFPDSA